MSERAAQLAAEFESEVAAFGALVESLQPDQLSLQAVNTPGPRFMDQDEARPVNVIAYHVASFMPRHTESFRARANGETPTPNDASAINAAEAEEKPDVTSAEALERLAQEAPRTREFIRGLTDEQLDLMVQLPMGEFTVEQLIRMVLIGHLDMHRKSIEATLDQA